MKDYKVPITTVLRTADDTIDALGGTTIAGRKLGMSAQRVNNWRERGIPPEYSDRLRKMLRQSGMWIDGVVFNMKE